MEKTIFRSKWWNAAALLLVLPTVYFIVIALLKYEFGMNGPFDAIAPWLEQAGISEPLGWNINLLILFGPVIAAGISLLQVLHIEAHFSKEQFQFHVTVLKKWQSLAIVFLSGLVLAFLFFYMVGENCNC